MGRRHEADAPRTGGPRFLTDVIVELGLCEADKVEAAIATARTAGSTPEQELLAVRRDQPRQPRAGRSPSVTASSTSTSPRSRSTWPRPA